MSTGLLLLLCLTSYVFAKEQPDVDCLVVHLTHVHCSWNKQGVPEVNYTFQSRFGSDEFSNCTTYVSENHINIGCNQSYVKGRRFNTFDTILTHGNKTVKKVHHLKERVLLYPPVNLTVKNGSDFNLWFYWNQTATNCVESNVRFRTNNNNWEFDHVTINRQSFCINLPSSRSRYELQVQSRMGNNCGESLYWSNWSEPVVWGSNNSTDPGPINVSAWTPLLYVVGAFTLILLVMMLLHHERLRIIPIPVVPKPSPVFHNIEDWLQFSKGLKGNFKANYNEHACPVREYCPVSQADSESSDGSSFSVTTDQTNCSVSIPMDKSSDQSSPCSSSTSAILISSQEEQHGSV